MRVPVVSSDHGSLLPGRQRRVSANRRTDLLAGRCEKCQRMIEFHARRRDTGQLGNRRMDVPPSEVLRSKQVTVARRAMPGDQQMTGRDIARGYKIAAAREGATERIGK